MFSTTKESAKSCVTVHLFKKWTLTCDEALYSIRILELHLKYCMLPPSPFCSANYLQQLPTKVLIAANFCASIIITTNLHDQRRHFDGKPNQTCWPAPRTSWSTSCESRPGSRPCRIWSPAWSLPGQHTNTSTVHMYSIINYRCEVRECCTRHGWALKLK